MRLLRATRGLQTFHQIREPAEAVLVFSDIYQGTKGCPGPPILTVHRLDRKLLNR